MKISIFNDIICRTPSKPMELFKNVDIDDFIDNFENDEHFIYSVFLSSPKFYHQLLDNKEKTQKIKLTLFKYFIRSCYRTIPFGSFSGIGLIKYNGNDTEVKLNSFNLKSAIDYDFFANNLEQKFILDKYFTNPTVIKNKVNSLYKYIEFKNEKANSNYEYSIIKNNYYLDLILKKASKGITHSEIFSLLEKEGFEPVEINSFIEELINSNLLLNTFYSSLTDCSNSNHTVHSFSELESKIKHIDLAYNYSDKLKRHIELKRDLKGEDLYSDNLLYTNLFCDFEGGLSTKQKKLINESIVLLDDILSRFPAVKMENFSNFIKNFEKRYEEESVSILEVINPESGIIFREEEPTEKTDWCFLDDYFCEKIFRNINQQNIDINDKEISQIRKISIKQSISNSPTGNARINIYKDGDNDIINIRSLCSNSPIRVLSRFSNIDHNIDVLCSEIANYEKESLNNVILAEIDYLPNSSVGNLVIRKNYRDLKIVFNSPGCFPNTLAINDVFLKMIDGELILYSKTLKKQILPYFSNTLTMENKEDVPLVIRFLLNYNNYFLNRKIGGFNTQKYHTYYKHIPRISYKDKIILSKESWLIKEGDFFIKSDGSLFTLEESINNFNQKREALKLPQIFDIIIEDIETAVDTTKKLSVLFFLSELKKHKKLIIVECLPFRYESIVKADSYSYNNEFFIPYKNLDFKVGKDLKFYLNKKVEKVKRHFLPGSEWLYYKIYLKESYANKFLMLISKKLLRLIKLKKINSFFYLKFFDDGFHIRLRVKLSSIDEFGFVAQYVENIVLKLYSDSIIENIRICTYTREIERYEFENIETVENIFWIDSSISLKLLEDKNIQNKWIASIPIVEMYLSFFFRNDLNEKIRFINQMKNTIYQEINGSKDTTLFLNNCYSENRKMIDYSLDKDFSINEHIKKIYFYLSNLKFSNVRNEHYYASNLIHMHITRIVNEKNKLYELLVYDVLLKRNNFIKHSLNKI